MLLQTTQPILKIPATYFGDGRPCQTPTIRFNGRMAKVQLRRLQPVQAKHFQVKDKLEHFYFCLVDYEVPYEERNPFLNRVT